MALYICKKSVLPQCLLTGWNFMKVVYILLCIVERGSGNYISLFFVDFYEPLRAMVLCNSCLFFVSAFW